MARRFTLELIMDLASRIGANPAKAISRSNISFLGKGPTKNPLFQNRLAGLENATTKNLGKPETLFKAVEDALGWAKDGKLNSIQTEILGHNLKGIDKIINPPPLPTLPMASVTPIRSGIAGIRKSPKRAQEIMDDMAMIEDPASVGLKRFPKESHKFFGRPLKDKDFSEIDRMVMEGKIPDARGRQWNLRGQETGPEAFTAALNQQTGMSRAIARNLLLKDTRLNLKPEELFMLREGKGEPLDLMRKYYGESMGAYDDFLNSVNLQAARPDEFAEMILQHIKLTPQFASGGLARILEV